MLQRANGSFQVFDQRLNRVKARIGFQGRLPFGVSERPTERLMHNRSGQVSVNRLMQALTLLDRGIEVTVRPKAAGHDAGHVSLVVQS